MPSTVRARKLWKVLGLWNYLQFDDSLARPLTCGPDIVLNFELTSKPTLLQMDSSPSHDLISYCQA
jgi:hypothetical protein